MSVEEGKQADVVDNRWESSRWTLRFVNEVSEAAFVASRVQRVQLFRFARIAALGASLLTLFSQMGVNNALTTTIIRGCEVFMNSTFLVFENTRAFRSLTPSRKELYLSVHAALFPVSRFVANDYIVSKLLVSCNLLPESHLVEFKAYMYGGFVLGILSMCMLGDIMPARSMLLLPMDIVGTVCFVGGIYLFPHDETPHSIMAMHVAVFPLLLAVIHSRGRERERCDRELFMRMAVEKTLRCTAEREAEAAASFLASGARPKDPDDRLSSAALSTTFSTTFSGKMFRQGQTSMDVQVKLQGIGNLGASEHWLIDLDELRAPKIPQALGVGGFGLVMPASFHGAAVVVKAHRATGRGCRTVDSIVQELRLLRRLRHPILVTFYGACVEPATGELMLVLEHIHGCELPRFAARSREEVGLSDRIAIAQDVACAVAYLHSQSPAVVHGDIKGTNVLVELLPGGGWRGRLLDFGLSRIARPTSARLGGTRLWAAPEVFGGVGEPHPSADVFSCGWLLFMVVTGLHPRCVVDGGTSPAELPERAAAAMQVAPATLVRLTRASLQTDAEAHPGAAECLDVLMQCRANLERGTSDSATDEPALSLAVALAIVRTELSRQTRSPRAHEVVATRSSL